MVWGLGMILDLFPEKINKKCGKLEKIEKMVKNYYKEGKNCGKRRK